MLREVGQQIRTARVRRGWSQAELGRRAGGLNKETINRIELGANTTFGSIGRILEALELPWSELGLDGEKRDTAARPVTDEEASIKSRDLGKELGMPAAHETRVVSAQEITLIEFLDNLRDEPLQVLITAAARVVDDRTEDRRAVSNPRARGSRRRKGTP